MPPSPAAPGPAGGPSLPLCHCGHGEHAGRPCSWCSCGSDAEQADERHAWDLYAAAVITVDDFEPSEAAAVADLLLSERRKRWGGAPEGGK